MEAPAFAFGPQSVSALISDELRPFRECDLFLPWGVMPFPASSDHWCKARHDFADVG